MAGITKRFPGVLANDHIDLELKKGKIHGLLGENGAGKTTLMNILFGLYQPDEGKIYINGQEVSLRSPADAIEHGIGMVHQHFKLVPPFTVTENVILGIKNGAFIDLKKAEEEVRKVAEEYQLKIDPSARVRELSVGEQQRVEILSSLFRGVDLLILDEPTAVLTPQEAESLAQGLRIMADQGKVIVFISHKLEEVMHITDWVTVLRGGQVVFNTKTSETTKEELAREMIGRDLEKLHGERQAHILALAGAQEVKLVDEYESEKKEKKSLLKIVEFNVKDDRGLLAVSDLDFSIHQGEILGIAGVDGNGQKELAEAIIHLRPIESGLIFINGKNAVAWNTRQAIEHKIGYITDDRQNEGLILDFDLTRNAILRVFEQKPFVSWGLLNENAIIKFTIDLIKSFDIRTPTPFVRAGTLSGGNQQKLVLARELSQSPDLIIANKPTRGLDIGAAAYIHQKLIDERDRGAGIMLVSADLDEILLLSDRIMVMYNGQSMGILNVEEADSQTLGLMMAGTPLEKIRRAEVAK